MATRRNAGADGPDDGAADAPGSALSSTSGPAAGAGAAGAAPALPGRLGEHLRRLLARQAGSQALAAAMPANASKAAEFGGADDAPRGERVPMPAPIVGASTVSEDAASDKLGSGEPPDGVNRTIQPLDASRVDSTNRAITTNQGLPVGDNQNSVKAGLRGPTLLQDFILREKITHFDHERIPERVVHARGSAAHGYFESTQALDELTMAAPFAAAGKRTPVFVRFSTVAGERGSADTVRDVRGFAVKFYTEDGNWDIVGNNIPVFFIQDAMKFPDLVHAVKPEPHHGMPQASSAHDTFWDFVSLMPESTHMLLWQMSDRAIPRSYRTMQGFGVHTFRLVNARGDVALCKFHWIPVAGTHSLVWDEAAKLTGIDPDFHRRDLWESIEAGAFPAWDLALQVFTEAQAEQFPFDVLDATKIVPEEMVPLRVVGRLVLDRNPDNFFAETEQVAFCVSHVIPGIDFTNDPLLQGRLFSYLDTQLSRLGGANFHEIPINAPSSEVHNNQRDGSHRRAIARGRVAYEPNSLGGGCPFQAGSGGGFIGHREPLQGETLRAKPELFADFYSQARLFWISQSPPEQRHIINAFRFELTRVQVPAIRERVVSLLANVDAGLAGAVAAGLGIEVPPAQPALHTARMQPYAPSPGLSLRARPGEAGLAGRRIAILVAPGVDAARVDSICSELIGAGAVARRVGLRLGKVEGHDGSPIAVETTLEAAPSPLWDGVVIPDARDIEETLGVSDACLDFIHDQYRHCKPLLAIGRGRLLLDLSGASRLLEDGTPDATITEATVPGAPEGASDEEAIWDALAQFTVNVALHRDFRREEGMEP